MELVLFCGASKGLEPESSNGTSMNDARQILGTPREACWEYSWSPTGSFHCYGWSASWILASTWSSADG
jgi:hypothetical protein